MQRTVAVVTDTTSYLPKQWAQELNIIEVPVQVIVDGKSYREGVDISTHEVAQALREWLPVSTSRPSPGDFLAAYEQAAQAGAQHIVSAHISAELSGTYETARLAAKQSPVPVTVIDTRTLTMALGFACVSGGELAAAGGPAAAVAETIIGRAVRTKCLLYVDSMEYLKRGGRVGKTAAAVGAALRVKPILAVQDGRVEMIEKARTAGKALQRLLDLSVEAAGSDDVDIAVQHIDAQERADQLAARLRDALGGHEVLQLEIGAVVGAHVGPGMVSVVVSPRRWSGT